MKKILIIAFVLISIVLAAVIFGGIAKPGFDIESNTEEAEKIFPVLYYEKGVGGPGYNTNTFMISGDEAVAMEKHYRTFSRTYPSSAYENFRKNEAVYGEYGRLLVYYNSVCGEIFLFESYNENKFTLIKNDIKTAIYFNKGESYFDFLYFDGKFYLFTLENSKVLRAYEISESLSVKETYDINYGRLGVDNRVFIDNSVAVVKGSIFATLEKGLLLHNTKTGETAIISLDYSVFGAAADGNCFYAVGYTNSGKIVFEKFSPEGNSITRNEKELPFAFDYSPTTCSTDGTFYMYGSEIFMEIGFGEKDYLISYDVESEDWANRWVVEKKKEPFSYGNIKYMVKEGETFYDLFPYWCNK